MADIIIVGGLGAVVVLGAYLPQVGHLIKTRCSAGISRPAFWSWLLGYALLATYAIVYVHDATFISLQIGHLTLSTTILFFAYRYRGMRCSLHAAAAL